MKTCCVTTSVSRKAGGLFQSVRHLHLELGRLTGVGVEVLGLEDEFTAADLPRWRPLPVHALPVRGPRAFGYSPGFKAALSRGKYDLLHAHGIWMYPSCATLSWQQNTGRPHIISTRGMLDQWAINNSRWKKRIAGWLFENRNLHGAACLHALCEAEAQSMRSYGLKNPIAIIPNGVDLPELREAQSAECKAQEAGSKESEIRKRESGNLPSSIFHLPSSQQKVLLYLGRIHPKKGLVNLLKAWAMVNRKSDEWVLVIAGWDQGGHEKKLRMLSAECGIENSVVFLGPKFGEETAACYANCDAFILPSFSEGLPMVVLEAWAYGKPVLMTPECNLPEGFAANAALRIAPSAEGIANGLEELFRAPNSALHTLGDNGRNLAASHFAWPKIAADMKTVYEWVLGDGPKPECVRVD